MAEEPKSAMIPVEEALPAVNELVTAVSSTMQRLAYIDFRGHWRDHSTNEPLQDVIGWHH